MINFDVSVRDFNISFHKRFYYDIWITDFNINLCDDIIKIYNIIKKSL